MATSYDYTRQAQTYDRTRAASPSVLGPLLEALGPPRGTVVDVGGGTGNYAVALAGHGWAPVVVDFNIDMARRARSKSLPVVRGDASRLPVPTDSVAAVTLISMLHHVPDWRDALAESFRVVGPGGRVVVLGFSREHMDVHWLSRYFPTGARHFAAKQQAADELLAARPGAVVRPVFYEDVIDGSMAAMCRRPELMLDPDIARQTSFFEWIEKHTPVELEDGLSRLGSDLVSGQRPQDADTGRRDEIGDALLVSWQL